MMLLLMNLGRSWQSLLRTVVGMLCSVMRERNGTRTGPVAASGMGTIKNTFHVFKMRVAIKFVCSVKNVPTNDALPNVYANVRFCNVTSQAVPGIRDSILEIRRLIMNRIRYTYA